MHRTLPCLAFALAAGCGGVWPEVVDTRSLFAGGTPSIARIRDLGAGVPPAQGALVGDPDGVAGPGEHLLIEGSGFGKQPTVTIAGRAAEVVARTAGGGIVVRVPTAAGRGTREVVVTVGDTHARHPFALRQVAVALHRGRVHAVALDGERATVLGAPIELPGARAVRVASDGSCAYVLVGKRRLAIVDLGAAGGPRVIGDRDLQIDAVGLVAAEAAPQIGAVGDRSFQAFETTTPRQPARYDPAELPPEARGARAVELDPSGGRLALILPDGNRLVVVDVARRTTARLVATLPLLPEARVPLVRDLRFSSDGETLWIVAGDNPDSLTYGVQPTRVIGVRIEGGGEGHDLAVTPWRTAAVAGAGAPLRLVIPRRPPLAAGTAIRMPPEKASIFFTSVATDLWSAPKLAGRADVAALDQADMAGGRGHLFQGSELLGPGEFADEGLLLVAAASPATRAFGVLRVAMGAEPKAELVRLGTVADGDLAPPFTLAELAIQP